MTTRNAPLTTRNARRGLQPQARPYLRTIGQGVSLGYRKKATDGLWVINFYVGEKKYREAVVGTADDVQDADGVRVLNFEQARKAVLAKADEWRADAKAKAAGPIVTVGTAVKAYAATMNAREASQGRIKRDAENRLAWHVLSDPLADVGLHQLTETALSDWRTRRSEGRAESTVRRISNDLRAALNAAAKKYRATLPADLPTVIKVGLASESHDQPIARDDAALPDEDVRKLLDAAGEIDEEGGWDGDLHRLVVALAATGARFISSRPHPRRRSPSRARQVDGAGQPQGQGRKEFLAYRRPHRRGCHRGSGPRDQGPDGVGAAADALGARSRSADGFANWKRTGRTPWKTPSEIRRPWAEIVKRAGLPAEFVPYALRHSSIVRALGAGLPVRLVAAMHDTSTAMIEKHYSGPSRRCWTTWPVRRSCRWSGRRNRRRWFRSGADRPRREEIPHIAAKEFFVLSP